jgi:hypothetical protein
MLIWLCVGRVRSKSKDWNNLHRVRSKSKDWNNLHQVPQSRKIGITFISYAQSRKIGITFIERTWWRLFQSFDFERTWWRLFQSFDLERTWWRKTMLYLVSTVSLCLCTLMRVFIFCNIDEKSCALYCIVEELSLHRIFGDLILNVVIWFNAHDAFPE